MFSYGLYRALTTAARFGVDRLLQKRLAQGKEDPQRLSERLGQPGQQRTDGCLIWLHGASIGEAASLLPVIERLRGSFPDINLLLTTGTRTSATIMAERLPDGVIHQYVPVDLPAAATSFLDHWRPDLMIWSESDLWPNLLMEADRRAIPRILLNGRMSEKSFRNWRFGRPLIGPLLKGFALVLAQTTGDGDRLSKLGASNVRCLGNLKLAAAPPPVSAEDLTVLQAAIGPRPVWLMASTHPDEEILAARVHAALRADLPDLLTIIVPRHAERAEAVVMELQQAGLSVTRRSDGLPDAQTDIFLGDTMGEMGLYYRLSPIVVMGKTFPDAVHRTGGQNPLEPAQLGCSVLWGPGMENFSDIAAAMIDAGAARSVADEIDLRNALRELLDSAEAVARMARAAKDWTAAERAVLDRVMLCLDSFISPLTTPEGSRARA